MTGRFYIDGLDLYTQYSITVLKSEGEIDLAKPKKRFEQDWPDDHGVDADVVETYDEPKEITLECMLKQTTAANALTKLRALQTALNAAGLRQLKSHKDSPRVHMVHLLDDVSIERFEGGKLLLFKLKFREPIPHGRQFSVTGPQVVSISLDTLTIGNYFAVDVHWGDGTRTLNAVQGTDLEHTYASAGTYIIVISGSIEKADDFSITGATEI